MQPARTVIRALVLRQMDRGSSTVQAGAALGFSAKAAWQIGKHYLEDGLERAIYDAPRPGQKPLLDGEHALLARHPVFSNRRMSLKEAKG